MNPLLLTIVIPNRFIGEESAFAPKTTDFARDTAALRNDNSCKMTQTAPLLNRQKAHIHALPASGWPGCQSPARVHFRSTHSFLGQNTIDYALD
jgi:hypothetical protein